MNDDCIFCKISQGDMKCHKIYEDDDIFAFLDRNPVNPGHILVIPKKHVVEFFDLDDELYSKVWLVVKRISKVVHKIMKPKKVGILVSGWDVPHTHIHVVPLHDYHDITLKSLLDGKRNNTTDEDLAEVAAKIVMN